jgi:phenylalanyl-tRNA synthetase beta chain
MIVPEATTVDAVLAEIRTAAGDLIADATLAAVERGLPDGMKGLTFALTYQAADRALSEKEVAKAHEKVEGRLKHVLKAQIRNPNAT